MIQESSSVGYRCIEGIFLRLSYLIGSWRLHIIDRTAAADISVFRNDRFSGIDILRIIEICSGLLIIIGIITSYVDKAFCSGSNIATGKLYLPSKRHISSQLRATYIAIYHIKEHWAKIYLLSAKNHYLVEML